MLYGDDTTIYHSCPDPQELQEARAGDLSRMAEWLKTNHLCMNVRKTKLLLPATRGRAQDLDQVGLTVNDVEVERRNYVKFLGVIIDSELTWEKHVATVRRKCFGSLAMLRCLRHPLPVSLKARLYSVTLIISQWPGWSVASCYREGLNTELWYVTNPDGATTNLK